MKEKYIKPKIVDIIKNNKFVGEIYCDNFLVFRNKNLEIVNVDNAKIRMQSRNIINKVQSTTINDIPVFMIRVGTVHLNNERYLRFYVYCDKKFVNKLKF